MTSRWALFLLPGVVIASVAHAQSGVDANLSSPPRTQSPDPISTVVPRIVSNDENDANDVGPTVQTLAAVPVDPRGMDAMGVTADADPRPDADFLADHASRKPATFTAYWENDGGPIKPNDRRDRHYTNGLLATLTYQPDWADRLAPYVPGADGFGPARTGIGLVAGQDIFTPVDITQKQPILTDRPFAGYLFGGIYFERANPHTLDHIEVNVGLVGPGSQAEGLQKAVHKLYHGDTPRGGWNNQLGTEVTFQTFIRKKWRLPLNPIHLGDTRLDAQVIPQIDLALGTVYRYVRGGAALRLGYHLPDDFGPPRIDDPISAVGGPQHGFSIYGYARATGRVVEHNLFLDGNTFKDSQSVDKEPLVGELSAGIAAGYRVNGWAAQLSYAQTIITPEFKRQSSNDQFATLTLSLIGWF